jgi:class 3 adenylate cyclase
LPAISTGVYGYPPRDAACVAISATNAALARHQQVEEARFWLFDQQAYDVFAKMLLVHKRNTAPTVDPAASDAPAENLWHTLLIDGHDSLVRGRHLFRYVPSAPRCKLCNNPFGGFGGRIFALAGFKPSRKNPRMCSRCCERLPAGGAEVDVAALFADVRGSTTLGEQTPPAQFAELLNRFYAAATATLVRHDAVIDKLIGDEVMAFFVKGISGPHYRRRAVQAGIDLLRAVGYGTSAGPWLEVGAAVNAGVAYVGNVGTEVVDFTALGDPVNVAARMQGAATAGELLVQEGVADELLRDAALRTLQLRGRVEPVKAHVVTL